MRFKIRFAVGNRLGAASIYNLREVCVYLVDRYSLTEGEIEQIIKLAPGESFANKDMKVTRMDKPPREELS